MNSSSSSQRKVSFSENVTSFEIGKSAGVVANGGRNGKAASRKADAEEEVAWYQDADVLAGLALFSGMAVVSAMVSFSLSCMTKRAKT